MRLTNKPRFFAPLAAAVLILAACDQNAKERKTPTMTPLTPRLQSVFEKSKTICFGRFMVDVPQSATVAWGKASVPISATIYPNGVSKVKVLEQDFIEKLKSEKAINHDDVPLLLSVDDIAQPEGKIVTGYDGFEAINRLKINGYFKLNNDGVIFDTYSFKSSKDKDIALIKSIARRLRLRAENEIPNEPGNCIEYAFLPDELGAEREHLAELVRIGFRLNEFPDTHVSIFVRPANPHKNESNSLKWQLERLEKNLKVENPSHPRLKTKYFRRGAREIYDWVDGFEALSRSPDQAGVHGIHDFGMDFQGVPYDPLKPYVDIRMQTGVANNAAGATKPSLTDEEAIAVWDKITSTIRVRPTGAAAVKTADTDTQPRLPLGELAATGRSCPQTGMWESSEPSGTENSRRRYIKAGETMPRVTVSGAPSLWQRLTGAIPSYQLATMWKLVDYDDKPALAKSTPQPPSIAQLAPRSETTMTDDPGGIQADAAPPKEHG
ncbi:T6SS immunity protein Tli4 family protein [Massilia alkalitolerans]|uniref:T6SS immunity protein Tli4 family protein n=1 Tax=Massilia alkalitolerans TaxID=286638 RepID=UPI000429EAD7|nr:T6SS immunity protein Tli4 family protein [Massilia alkalitolerans]